METKCVFCCVKQNIKTESPTCTAYRNTLLHEIVCCYVLLAVYCVYQIKGETLLRNEMRL